MQGLQELKQGVMLSKIKTHPFELKQGSKIHNLGKLQFNTEEHAYY